MQATIPGLPSTPTTTAPIQRRTPDVVPMPSEDDARALIGTLLYCIMDEHAFMAFLESDTIAGERCSVTMPPDLRDFARRCYEDIETKVYERYRRAHSKGGWRRRDIRAQLMRTLCGDRLDDAVEARATDEITRWMECDPWPWGDGWPNRPTPDDAPVRMYEEGDE